MEQVPENISFPKTEEEILKLWEKIDAFQTSLKKSEGKKEYSFYDGPPFATGTPHYGHILAGTIKDIVTRYAHQTGHHVTRRFGWDTHGLPIEFEIEKLLGIKTRDEVLKMGIPKYNAECRAIVMKYSKEWEHTITRLGRWIDFKNDYKTLDPTFMESVWWVFSQLFQKGLVYQGFKVMPYSTGCTTPLSNFEAGLNYQEVPDPSITVSFQLENDENTSFLVWTTTPWTLPSNLALCVNPDLTYVKIKDKKTEQFHILCETRLQHVYKLEKDPAKNPFEIIEKFKGSTLKGIKYVPLFDYFVPTHKDHAFVVVTDSYVKDDSGTGVVHQAPGFGEDDFRVCLANGIVSKTEIPCPIDPNGRFLPIVKDFEGQYIKSADEEIIKHLKKVGRMIKSTKEKHSYPYCWRSDTPLIYRTVPSWFVAVEKIKKELIEANTQSRWVPEAVQVARFHNWLVDARDWAVSRNRYWGTPIPIWTNGDEIVCIGSIAELAEKSGVTVTDLHRESIDHIEIPSAKGGKPLKRVEEVFDCWFESGSMPYAQIHYPFENQELFTASFPADFIAEGLDQTRGWFYTLMVLSTALFNKPAFKNVIVNGLVLAEDGKKMSKRLKNYPEPDLVIDKYGADALRLYLINSPVVKAESLKFTESGVKDVLKDLFIPWFNVYRFLVQNVLKYEKDEGKKFAPDVTSALQSTNVMDKWIMAYAQSLIGFVRDEMAGYRLYTVVPRLVKFADDLRNWYVRFNRKRLRGSEGAVDTLAALNALFSVTMMLTRTMAPFTPFFTEYIYQNLKLALPESEREDSVHYLMIPEPIKEAANADIERAVASMQAVINLGRISRERRTLPLKTPLKEVVVVTKNKQVLDDLNNLGNYIKEELNIRNLVLTSDEASYIGYSALPDSKILGKKLRKDFDKVAKAIRALDDNALKTFLAEGKMTVEGYELTAEELKVTRVFRGDTKQYEAAWEEDVLVILNVEQDEELKAIGAARKVVNQLQKLRKTMGLLPENPIEAFIHISTEETVSVIEPHTELIKKSISASFTVVSADYSDFTAKSEPFKLLAESNNATVFIKRL